MFTTLAVILTLAADLLFVKNLVDAVAFASSVSLGRKPSKLP